MHHSLRRLCSVTRPARTAATAAMVHVKWCMYQGVALSWALPITVFGFGRLEEEDAVEMGREDGNQQDDAEDHGDDHGRRHHRAGGHAGLRQGQEIVDERRQDDKDAANREKRDVERLEDHQKRQYAKPDDHVLQLPRRRGRHSTAALIVIAHARTAFPSSANTWVCAGSGTRWSASPVFTLLSRATTTRISLPVFVRA